MLGILEYLIDKTSGFGTQRAEDLTEGPLQKGPDAGSRFAVRRSCPRYALLATAEIVEPVTKVQLSGRTSEIGAGGCHIDLRNTLPKGAVIQLSIERETGTFRSWGRVVYAHEAIGMGVQFFDLAPEDAQLLRKWIVELSESERTTL